MIGIYCCIGKTYAGLVKIARLLQNRGSMEHSIIVSAPASTTAGEQYLAPYSAASLGEYFMRHGKDVVLVFDDLTKHA